MIYSLHLYVSLQYIPGNDALHLFSSTFLIAIIFPLQNYNILIRISDIFFPFPP